jgi:hypothetical protein
LRDAQHVPALALDILTRRISVPRAIFIKHQLLTPSNVKQHYGRDLRAGKQSEKHGSAAESAME